MNEKLQRNKARYEIRETKGFPLTFFLEKTTDFEVCPKCAYKCYAGYDKRFVRIKDAPIRNGKVLLVVRKRRLWCPRCQKPFTEPLSGVGKGKRVTERLRKNLCVAAENSHPAQRGQPEPKCRACIESSLFQSKVFSD